MKPKKEKEKKTNMSQEYIARMVIRHLNIRELLIPFWNNTKKSKLFSF
jgi:hypothetical protein